MDWPNLFLVGAPKAGTTSLWRYLSQHPSVFMSPVKEPHFFSGGADAARPVTEEDAYLALFTGARGHRLVGEASTTYLWHPASADAIALRAPAARIVVSLREPVDRTRSSYWMWRRRRGEHRSFDEAVREEIDAGLTEQSGIPTRHVGRSFYARDLKRYLDRFEHVHVLFFEDLAVRHEQVLRGLFTFLEVDADVASRIEPRRHNTPRVPRTRLLGPFLASEAAVRAGTVLPAAVRALAWKDADPPETEAETLELLSSLFHEDTREVEALVGRPLPWG